MVNPKLCKAIETLVDNCGSIDGRTRMLKLIYLADKAWHKEHGAPYTEAKYFRWNHGPYAKEVLRALEWMDGVEIVQTQHEHPNGTIYRYEPGERTRLRKVLLDNEFERMLVSTAKQWKAVPLQRLLKHVYSDPTFDATNFGDALLTPRAAA